jgi:uncharacterized protein (TIGR03067 family)
MRGLGVAAAAAALVFLPGADERDGAAKKDLDKLQGTWVMESIELDGRPPAEQDVTTGARRELVIKGDQYTEGQVSGRKVTGFVRIDPSRKPRTMDRSATRDFAPGKTNYAIYELSGDTLTMCSREKAGRPEQRPTAFKTAPGSGAWVIHWKRKS